jgi:hypothetical protein
MNMKMTVLSLISLSLTLNKHIFINLDWLNAFQGFFTFCKKQYTFESITHDGKKLTKLVAVKFIYNDHFLLNINLHTRMTKIVTLKAILAHKVNEQKERMDF